MEFVQNFVAFIQKIVSLITDLVARFRALNDGDPGAFIGFPAETYHNN